MGECAPSTIGHDLLNQLAIVTANCELLMTSENPLKDLPFRAKTIYAAGKKATEIAALMKVPNLEFIHSSNTIELVELHRVIRDELVRRAA